MIVISVWGQKVDSDRYFKQVWTSLRLPRQPFYQTSGFYLRIYCSLIELTFSYIFSGLYIFLLIFCSVLWILISRCTKFLFITRQRELLQSRWSAMAAKCMFQALLLTKLGCWCNSTLTKDKRTYLLKAFWHWKKIILDEASLRSETCGACIYLLNKSFDQSGWPGWSVWTMTKDGRCICWEQFDNDEKLNLDNLFSNI